MRLIDNQGAFCDWLSVSQTHRHKVPEIHESITMQIESDTGEILFKKGDAISHRGSFETSLRVSTNGHRVALSGNVGRFGRPDNVFGYSLDECKRKANEVLSQLGLPPFTAGEFEYLQARDGKRAKKVYTGAIVSRVDMTTNHSMGTGAKDFMYWLSSQKLSRSKVEAVGDGETVYWGKKGENKYVLSKAYLKGLEIEYRLKKSKRNRSITHEQREYLKRLSEWANNEGIVRHETLFAERYLNQKGLKPWCQCTHENLKKHYQIELEKMLERCQMDTTNISLSNSVTGTYHQYLNGVNVRAKLSRPTFYRHKKELLKFGIDLSLPPTVRALNVRPRLVEIRPASIPDFYQLDEVA